MGGVKTLVPETPALSYCLWDPWVREAIGSFSRGKKALWGQHCAGTGVAAGWLADGLAHFHSTAATLTFWSPRLLLTAFILRVTSSLGSRGHLEDPVGFFLAGVLLVTSTTTPGGARMLKDVQSSGAELWKGRGGQRDPVRRGLA